jgi:hypothetical protein
MLPFPFPHRVRCKIIFGNRGFWGRKPLIFVQSFGPGRSCVQNCMVQGGERVGTVRRLAGLRACGLAGLQPKHPIDEQSSMNSIQATTVPICHSSGIASHCIASKRVRWRTGENYFVDSFSPYPLEDASNSVLQHSFIHSFLSLSLPCHRQTKSESNTSFVPTYCIMTSCQYSRLSEPLITG